MIHGAHSSCSMRCRAGAEREVTRGRRGALGTQWKREAESRSIAETGEPPKGAQWTVS